MSGTVDYLGSSPVFLLALFSSFRGLLFCFVCSAELRVELCPISQWSSLPGCQVLQAGAGHLVLVQEVTHFTVETVLAVYTARISAARSVLGWAGWGEGHEDDEDDDASEAEHDDVYWLLSDCIQTVWNFLCVATINIPQWWLIYGTCSPNHSWKWWLKRFFYFFNF